MGNRPARVAELVLVAEARIVDLFPAGGAGRMEASGVLTVDDGFLVVFDDSRTIGKIGSDLGQPRDNRVITPSGAGPRRDWDGFEDIAADPVSGTFYLLVEAAERDDGGWMAMVEQVDAQFVHVTQQWLPFSLPDAGKGMEGLTCVLHDGRPYLLAICEGNRCEGGKAGKRPGGGRVQVFGPAPEGWVHTATINLPEFLWFIDFSSVSVRDDRIAVTSQESSALWLGRFDPATWQITDQGTVYEFPRDADDRALYCMVEGIAWIEGDRFVAVSDRAKSATPNRCRDKQQSVHIFDLPRP